MEQLILCLTNRVPVFVFGASETCSDMPLEALCKRHVSQHVFGHAIPCLSSAQMSLS